MRRAKCCWNCGKYLREYGICKTRFKELEITKVCSEFVAKEEELDLSYATSVVKGLKEFLRGNNRPLRVISKEYGVIGVYSILESFGFEKLEMFVKEGNRYLCEAELNNTIHTLCMLIPFTEVWNNQGWLFSKIEVNGLTGVDLENCKQNGIDIACAEIKNWIKNS
ncbi:MAG: hypothetical protein ACRCTZ_16075 [Sarcina sp.]